MVAAEAPAPLPGPIDPTETFRFASKDGTELYGEAFIAGDPRAAAIVVHGYGDHAGRYRELAHVLTDLGLTTLAYDTRGHGRAAGQRGHVRRFSEYLDDLDAALAQLAKRAAGADKNGVLAIAHSHGGLVVLRALTDPGRTPAAITAAILSSPFLGIAARVSPAKAVIGRIASRLSPHLSLPSGIVIDHLTHDPQKRAERRGDSLCHDVASARWYTEMLAAHAYVREHAARVSIPTAWLVASSDLIVDPACSRQVYRGLRAPAEYHELSGLYHEVMNETDRGAVFGLIKAFIQQKFLPQ